MIPENIGRVFARCYPISKRCSYILVIISIINFYGCATKPNIPELTEERWLEVVESLPGPETPPEDFVALAICMSGGGYRATLFSLGALAALHDMGVLKHAHYVGGVSGGSITAAYLGLRWSEVAAAQAAGESLFTTRFANDLFSLTDKTIDIPSVLSGAISPFTTAPLELAKRLDRNLFRGAVVEDIWDEQPPVFQLIATDMRRSKVFTSSSRFLKLWPRGIYDLRNIPLSSAVAASAAYPPFFAPASWRYLDGSPDMLLGDGGLVDNIGITACDLSKNKIVIDARTIEGPEDEKEFRNWSKTIFGSINIMHNKQQDIRLLQEFDGALSSSDRDLEEFIKHLEEGNESDARDRNYYVKLSPLHRSWMWTRSIPWNIDNLVFQEFLLENLAQGKTPTVPFDRLVEEGHKLCVNIPTRFKGLPNKTKVGIVQWGYIRTWLAVDGREVDRINDNMSAIAKERQIAMDAIPEYRELAQYFEQLWEEQRPIQDALSSKESGGPDQELFDQWMGMQDKISVVTKKLSAISAAWMQEHYPSGSWPLHNKYRLPYSDDETCFAM